MNPVMNSKIVEEDFRDGCQTIGRTGGIGNDRVILRVVLGLIHSQHQSNIRIFGRCGNNDTWRSRLKDADWLPDDR